MIDNLKNLKKHLMTQIAVADSLGSQFVYIITNEAKKCLELAEAEDVIMKMMDEQPEIVRCKDCKHGKPGACGDGVDCDGVWHDDDWFCADGVKRDD